MNIPMSCCHDPICGEKGICTTCLKPYEKVMSPTELKNMNNLSSCCNAPVGIATDRSNTAPYVCVKCGKPCSLAPDKVHTMQVPPCTCASFFTVKGKHKPDCPYFTPVTSQDGLREEFYNEFTTSSKVQIADHWLKIIAERDAKMLAAVEKIDWVMYTDVRDGAKMVELKDVLSTLSDIMGRSRDY